MTADFPRVRVCREFRAQAWLVALHNMFWGKSRGICTRRSPPGWVHVVENRDSNPAVYSLTLELVK